MSPRYLLAPASPIYPYAWFGGQNLTHRTILAQSKHPQQAASPFRDSDHVECVHHISEFSYVQSFEILRISNTPHWKVTLISLVTCILELEKDGVSQLLKGEVGIRVSGDFSRQRTLWQQQRRLRYLWLWHLPLCQIYDQHWDSNTHRDEYSTLE